MELHNILFGRNPEDLRGIQLVINAADLSKCFHDMQRWVERCIREESSPEYYTRHELAELLHVTLTTIDKYAASGKLPKPIKQGRRTLFEKAATNFYIRNDTPPRPRCRQLS